MRSTFDDGHGEYVKQEANGNCARSTDLDYDFDNLTEMYETSDSVYQCAVACNQDETCVAFDYQTGSGYCYAYKEDPLASYVGSGTVTQSDWNCYTYFSITADCDSIYQETVNAIANISLLQYNLYIQVNGLISDNTTLESEKSDLIS
jgi:hypothetical protein